jgi:hypothetical protein
LVLNDALLAQFRDSLDNTVIEEFYQIAKKQAQANEQTAAEKTSAKALQTQIAEKRAILYGTDHTQKAAALTDLEALQTQYKTYLQVWEASRSLKIADAKAINTAINPMELYVQNEKFTNTVFLDFFAQPSQAEPDRNTIAALKGIAAECPIIGGPAVYRARAMIYRYDKTIYEDHDLCAQQGVSFRTQKPVSKIEGVDANIRYSINPNPAQNFTVLKSNRLANEDQTVSISDTYGRVVSTILLLKGSNQAIISTETWASGIYYCKINESLYKIVVIK